MAIPYINGYTIKPNFVSPSGIVTFTDGTNDISPNQQQCEAYGFTYNEATGTCTAYKPTLTLNRSIRYEDSKLEGSGNEIESGTKNTIITGENNIVKGISRNNIIIGTSNEIANDVNNANVYGTLAQATATNSIVLGGNEAADVLGERQNITLMYGVTTTDNSTVDAYLNNTTNSYFVVPDNAVIYFQSETLAVRVGGGHSAGNVGDFKAWVERGVVKNARGTLSIDRSRTSPADYGTTGGWSPVNNVSGTNFRQTCTGATDMIIEWVSTIRITQLQTSVEL
jgi:hypothetical protein